MTPAKTSGVIYVSLRCTPLAGVLQAANPSYLQKVSLAESQRCVRVAELRCWWSLCFLLAGIQHKYSNWKAFLVKRLTGAKTLPPDFSTKVGLLHKVPAFTIIHIATDHMEHIVKHNRRSCCICLRSSMTLAQQIEELRKCPRTDCSWRAFRGGLHVLHMTFALFTRWETLAFSWTESLLWHSLFWIKLFVHGKQRNVCLGIGFLCGMGPPVHPSNSALLHPIQPVPNVNLTSSQQTDGRCCWSLVNYVCNNIMYCGGKFLDDSWICDARLALGQRSLFSVQSPTFAHKLHVHFSSYFRVDVSIRWCCLQHV